MHGELQRLQLPDLTPAETKQLVYSVLTDAQKKRFEESNGARLLVRHHGGLAALPLQRLQPARRGRRGLPADPREDPQPSASSVCRRCWRRWPIGPRGLVLVTGPTGSGKSTTLAAMLDKINSERHEHILTIEDPIEYIHQHKNCLVNQREVHSDTDSFSAALRAALREDPDIVLIGEMRDLETVEVGAEDRRDRPPDVRHAAHELGGADDQPHHRHLPGEPAGADPHAALARARRASSARRCCRAPTARDASARSRSWCRRPRSGT